MKDIESAEKIPHSFNKELVRVLSGLVGTLNKLEPNPLLVEGETIGLVSGGKEIVVVNSSDILVLGKSFQEIFYKQGDVELLHTEKIISFFEVVLADKIIGLNHFGVSYFVDDLDKEKKDYKDLAKKIGVGIYSDETAPEDQEWLFVGDIINAEATIFELVLNKGQDTNDVFRPHFQIDIDTNLTIDEIRSVTKKHFGEGFIKWELDEPGHGVVLAMGFLGDAQGSKIAIGIGTNIRNIKVHRENMVELVS